MNILFGLAPYILFAIVERLAGAIPGLVTGLITAEALLIRDWIGREKGPKVLELGSAVLFATLAAYRLDTGAVWSVVDVRLLVDAGLLLLMLVSMVMRDPLTMQYAKEPAPQSMWKRAEFIRRNYIATAVWAAAFAVMVGVDLLVLYAPDLPLEFSVGPAILTIFGAVRSTSWYTQRLQAQAKPPLNYGKERTLQCHRSLYAKS